MTHFSAYRSVGSRLLACLLLALSHTLQAQCPAYPRAMDQVYVCYHPDGTLSFDQRATLHNPVRFTFPAFPADVTVYFDYDANDNIPKTVVNSGQIITVSYPSPGQRQLHWETELIATENDIDGNPVPYVLTRTGNQTFQTNFNNVDANYGDFVSHDIWMITGDAYTPPPTNAYPPGDPRNNATAADCMVHVLYADPDHQLRKPFILVEGFDPITGPANEYAVNDAAGNLLGYGSLRWDVVVTGRNESFDDDPTNPGIPHTPQFALLPGLISQIRSRGYDVVYVDFANAGNYIQANGNALIKVLEEVNKRKITSEQNVIVGASMGGLVCRYALSKMEQEGKTHCSGLFFTLDSPHNGANIPLGLQALGWFYHATGSTDQLWTALNAPAARQQLLLQLGTEFQAGRVVLTNNHDDRYVTNLSFDELTGSDYAALRNTLMDDMNTLGWPQMPRKIALLDGMKNGTAVSNQGFGPGDKYYDASVYANSVDLGTVFKLAMRSNNSNSSENFTINGMEDCGKWSHSYSVPNMLFTVSQPYDFNPCNPLGLGNEAVPYKYHSVSLRSNADLPALDNAPGGFRTDITTIHARLQAQLPGGNVTFNNPVKFPILSFVPTWSSLAMATPLNNANLNVDLTTSEFTDNNLPNIKVPNFDYFYAPTANLRHVELDGGMVALILQEIDMLDAGLHPGTLSEEYNYGLDQKVIPTTIVSETGVLNINNTGPTGYVNHPNAGGAAIKPVFTTYLNQCGERITVESGGTYMLGSKDQSQHGITEVWNGATVQIKAGGHLVVNSSQSALIVKSGGTLIIEAGALIELSDLSQEDGGACIKIEPGGTLRIEGKFELAGNGYIWLQSKEGLPAIYEDLRSAVSWQGDGRNIRRLFLDGFLLQTGGKDVLVENIQIDCRGAGSIDATDSDVHINEARIEGVGYIGENSGMGITTRNATEVIVQNADFIHLSRGLAIAEMPNASIAYPYINACHFDDCNIGLLAQNLKQLNVRGSQFTQCAGAAMALFGVHSLAHIAETIITGSGAGTIGTANDLQEISQQSPPYYAIVDPLTDAVEEFGHNNWGVYAHDVTRFRMTGGVIEDCEQGVYSPTGSRSNFVFSSHAVIQNNRAGIHIQEGYKETSGDAHQFFGMVMLDCAKLLDNHVGILGVNALLQMDAFSNSGTTNPLYVRSNHFRRISNAPATEINRLFHICYAPEYGISQIQARGNYWQNLTNSSADWRLRTAGDNTQCFANNGNGLFPLVINPIANATPTGCPAQIIAGPGTPGPGPGPQPQDPDECAAPPDSEFDEKIGVYFYQAYKTYSDEAESTGDFAGSDALFQKVANLKDEEVELLNENCRKYVRISRAFVQATPGGKPDKPEERSSGMYGEQSIHLQPNPAHEALLVTIDNGNRHILRLWNAYGSLVREMPVEAGQSKIDTENLPGGIYLLEVETAGIHTFKKVIIQH